MFNRLIAPLVRLGVVPHTYLLTTKGRKTGELRTTPVFLIEGDERWLVAPYGPVGWVHNIRALPRIVLRKGHRLEEREVVEATPEEAAPVLRTYLKWAIIVWPFFDVRPWSPAADIIAEAPRHPVFRIVDPVEGQPSTS
jgi:deazaflavin-dependent oxidoreductase (nitroreductase family)